jgi:hypothetical protein
VSLSSISNLTVSKICHEITNYLSVIKFIQEDLSDQNISELNELFANINMIECILKFFRGIYTSFNDDLTSLVKFIFILKNITLIDEMKVLEKTACTRVSNVICGLLYVVTKACKVSDVVSITRGFGGGYSISIRRPQFSLPQSAINAFNNEDAEANAFNVFCKYLNSLAGDENCRISVGRTEAGCQKIELKARNHDNAM